MTGVAGKSGLGVSEQSAWFGFKLKRLQTLCNHVAYCFFLVRNFVSNQKR